MFAEDVGGREEDKWGVSSSGRFFRLENQNCAISEGTQGGEPGQNRDVLPPSFLCLAQTMHINLNLDDLGYSFEQ